MSLAALGDRLVDHPDRPLPQLGRVTVVHLSGHDPHCSSFGTRQSLHETQGDSMTSR
jgi:hypothetical protein